MIPDPLDVTLPSFMPWLVGIAIGFALGGLLI
jgi:hypothetical protein